MVSNNKSVADMTPVEYSAAKSAALRRRPGMTQEERADLAKRRGDPSPVDVRFMSAEDYQRHRQAAIRGNTISGKGK